MKRVHVLPPDIVSKIAAGEVVDRPASVIKELLENALDASADRIEVELEQAGKTRLVIRDNGSGIDPDDLETIFQRHSTSKIQSADDLWDIQSLGFRGEALYSIAAVSDITLRSRTREHDAGHEIHLRAGERLGVKALGMTPGTEIQVQELFFNTPARRKFLKSDAAELNQVLDIIIPYTLLFPEKRFKVTHNGKTLIDAAPSSDAAARVSQVLNLNKDFFIQGEEQFEVLGTTVSFILGDINILRTKRDLQFLFINGRPVENAAIRFHMNNVYRLILPPRHYPFFYLNLDLPARDIDVNIHPTKREVKIHHEAGLCQALRRMTEQSLMQGGSARQASDGPATAPSDPPLNIRRLVSGFLDRELTEPSSEEPVQGAAHPTDWTARPATNEYAYPANAPDSLFADHALQARHLSMKERFIASRFIGAFHYKYLFFESATSLLMVDQHAAQERITFERLVEQMQNSRVEIQHLLTPFTLTLTPQEKVVWATSQSVLEAMGFSTTQFDETTLAIHTHPALIPNAEWAVHELLTGGDLARCDHQQLARRACRASVMSGDPMSAQQVEFQRTQLLACRDPFTCPHGRPIVVELTTAFLDKQFLRT